MNFRVLFTSLAKQQLADLSRQSSLGARYKAVLKCLARLEADPRHPGLNTHKYHGLAAPDGLDMFEAYAQNRTPGAYRVFWFYGPTKGDITIYAITPHP